MSEVVPKLEPFWLETYGDVARTGTPIRFESGAVSMGRWFDVHALRVGEPELHRVAILFNDITDRRRLERHLEDAPQQRTDERDMGVAGEPRPLRGVRPRWLFSKGKRGLDGDAGLVSRRGRRPAFRCPGASGGSRDSAHAFETISKGEAVDDVDVRLSREGRVLSLDVVERIS